MRKASYPIIFTYRDVVFGQGFAAGVEVRGRSLLVQEDDGQCWMYGVNPGGFCEGAATQMDAAAAFNLFYKKILFDIAAETSDVGELRGKVKEFFDNASNRRIEAWKRAVDLVRRDEITLDWLKKAPSDEHKLGVDVFEISLEAPPGDANHQRSPRRLDPALNVEALVAA